MLAIQGTITITKYSAQLFAYCADTTWFSTYLSKI